MALNGVNTLVQKIVELKEMYSEFRLNLFKEAYPKYKVDPHQIEPGLRTELSYFLKRADELLKESKGIIDPVPNNLDPIESYKAILLAWDEEIISTPNEEMDIDEDEESEHLFRLEMH